MNGDDEHLQNFEYVLKKVIICGPPGAGKTTLKQIFFEKANPLRLLTTSLEPTRGFERSVYRQLSNEIAVFDLSGQENNTWFGQEKDIFQDTDLILNICPVTIPMKEVFTFLGSLLPLMGNQCPKSKLYILYHKRDLLSTPELSQRLRQLRQYLKSHEQEPLNRVVIYVTSIAEPFFFATYRIFGEILRKVMAFHNVSTKSYSFQQAELGLRILLECQSDLKYHVNSLLSQFRLSLPNTLQILNKLKEMNLVEFLAENNAKTPESFQLTDQAKFFVAGIRQNVIQTGNPTNKIHSPQKLIEFFSQMKKQKT